MQGISLGRLGQSKADRVTTTTLPLCLLVCTAHTGRAHSAPCHYTCRQERRSRMISAHTRWRWWWWWDTQNNIHDGSGFPKRSIPLSRAGPPGCLTDKVRGSSPLIQRHFGGAFQDDFLGGGCAHCGRLSLLLKPANKWGRKHN